MNSYKTRRKVQNQKLKLMGNRQQATGNRQQKYATIVIAINVSESNGKMKESH
jgi:hypothetical protein